MTTTTTMMMTIRAYSESDMFGDVKYEVRCRIWWEGSLSWRVEALFVPVYDCDMFGVLFCMISSCLQVRHRSCLRIYKYVIHCLRKLPYMVHKHTVHDMVHNIYLRMRLYCTLIYCTIQYWIHWYGRTMCSRTIIELKSNYKRTIEGKEEL